MRCRSQPAEDFAFNTSEGQGINPQEFNEESEASVQLLAARTLTGSDGAKDIRLELDVPVQATEDVDALYLSKGDWGCTFRIVKGGRSVVENVAVGSDAIEALVNAIAQLRAQFRASGFQAHFYEGDLDGLPAFLPSGFGAAFDRHIEDVVRKEEEAWAEHIERKHSGQPPRK